MFRGALTGPHFESLLIVVDGALEVVCALALHAVEVGGCQVVICERPVRGKSLTGIDLEGLLVMVDRLLEVVCALAPDAF